MLMSSYKYKGKKYTLQRELEFKHPETREWVEAVEYLSWENDQCYVREKKEFYERFERLIPNHPEVGTIKTLCSFCGKDKTEVRNLISGGPNSSEQKGDDGKPVYICNECIDLTQEIINQPMTDAMNEWLGDNGTENNEVAFIKGWSYIETDEEDPDFTQIDYTYDFKAGMKARRKYLKRK